MVLFVRKHNLSPSHALPGESTMNDVTSVKTKQPAAAMSKLAYAAPKLSCIGKLVDLTNSGGSNDREGGSPITGCDRIAKRPC